MNPVALIALALAACRVASAQDVETLEADWRASSDQHMRDELGVNDLTAPAISDVLRDLGSFRPIPLDRIAQNNRDAVYSNRMQTALHFGALVADGFLLTIAERPQDIHEVGRALIRGAHALGVGERLTKRSKSLFELSDSGNWAGMREELIRTQGDVEQSMLDLRDEEMAHMVSLGGWLRGFQLAAVSCSANYSPDRAAILGRAEVMDYFLDRLATLHPRLRKTEFATELTRRIQALEELAAQSGGEPSHDQVRAMAGLADQAVAVALGPVDPEGRILEGTR